MLDDFFVMAPTESECAHDLSRLLELCSDIGIPMAPEKTTHPSTCTSFLGIELDTISRQAKLPKDKLTEYGDDIHTLLKHEKTTKRQLESLIGKLNFAASVVPARPFLRRLIDLVNTVEKPNHFIRLTHGTKRDLLTWLQFLDSYNGVTYFRALKITNSQEINMVSDASHLGFGACYGRKWLQAPFPTDWRSLHITVLEMYPIFVLISVFGSHMRNSNVLFHCDNSAVTAIINKQSSKDATIMCIVRKLVLLLCRFNISLRSEHVPGVLNILPDKISRFQVSPQLLRHHGMDEAPTTIPTHLLPANFALL